MRLFKFELTGGPYGDETSRYELTFLKPDVTLEELMNYLLTEMSGEWGYIYLQKPDCPWYTGTYKFEYKWGSVVKDDIPSEYRSMILPNKIKASGGWSRMDYIIPID